ncbi:MAG: hypothetical protein ILO68_03305, partial [Clostridia bacterium]|nr:hypothetical protein [Clostridia bacterium]
MGSRGSIRTGERKTPFSEILLTVLFVLFLAGFLIAFLLVPDRTVSENENRTLQTFPEWTWEDWADGTFAGEMNDYFADQFPMREDWTAVKAMAELAAGKGGNNGVLVGENEQLAVYTFDACAGTDGYVSGTDGHSAYLVEKECEALAGLDASLREKNVPFCFLLAPRTIDVAASAFSYPDAGSLELLEEFERFLPEDLNAPSVIPELRRRYEAGEYVVYRTDHHWTTLGAYYAYEAVMRSWGMEEDVLPQSAFTADRTLSFYGTTWSK